MKRIKNIIKNNIKLVIGLIIGIIVSGTGVYAATILLASNQVGYDNTTSGLTSTNVQDALDELNAKASKCTSTKFNLGDYISLTPTSTSYTITTAMTGYTSDQTINPSELTLWRVVDIHCDGSVDMVSEYVSSTNVYFKGTTRYANYVGTLQTIAAQYAKPGYTIDTRMMGYGGQTSVITDTSAFDGTSTTAPSTTRTGSPTTGTGQEYLSGVTGDTLYLKDYQLVSNVYKSDTSTYGSTGLKTYKVGTTTATDYWLASRSYIYDSSAGFYFCARNINSYGNLSVSSLRGYLYIWNDGNNAYALRPILTLKSGVSVTSGSGTKNSPYILQ